MPTGSSGSRRSTPSISARSARRRFPITSPSGICCCRCASAFSSTSTCGRCGCCQGSTSPLANRSAADIDMVCVRENSEGEYAGLGGRIHVGTPHEVAEQTGAVHAARHRADPALRVRDRDEAAAQAAGERDQVERAAPLDGAVGRGGGARARRTTRRSSTGSITSTRSPRAWSRTRRRSTSSWRRTCSATS